MLCDNRAQMIRINRLASTATLTAFMLTAQTRPQYPTAPVTNQVDTLHGVQVADPYRTLENADAPTTQKFVEEQSALALGWLAKVPGREAVRADLTKLWNYERYSGLSKVGGHYFQRYNSGLQNQAVLQVMDKIDGTPRVLLDPNTYRQDGTAALNSVVVNWSGKLMAYAVAQAGSDWEEWRVRDIATGKDHNDLILWGKVGGVAWAPDDSGFYYSRFPEPPKDQVLTVAATDHKVYFHKLGTPQSADKLIYELPGKAQWTVGTQVLQGAPFVILYGEPGTPGKNTLAWIDLGKPSGKVMELVPAPDAGYEVLEAVDGKLFVLTTDHAPKGRIIAIDPANPGRANWKEIVPEGKDTLEGAQVVGKRMLLEYMKDAHAAARIVDLSGKGDRRGGTSRHWHCVVVADPPGRFRSLLQFHRLHHSTQLLQPGHRHRQEHLGPPTEGCLRPRPIRNHPGVLPQQGRHEGADVPQPQEGAEAGWQESDVAVRLWWL